MPPDFELFLPIEKVDVEKRMVFGYASTPGKDLQGEIVTLDAIKAALPDYMQWRNIREMHTSSAVGSAVEAHVNEKGLYIGAKIRDDAAWQKCIESSKGANDQVYRGFSIGGSKLEKVGDTINSLRLTEISLVDRPANPECKIDFAKGAGDIFAVDPAEPENTSLFRKAIDAIGDIVKLASGAVAADGAPLVAKAAVINPDALTADEVTDLNLKLAECDFEKREFSGKQRKHLASTGVALPDGSFPIANEADLSNAVYAVGRAADYGKAKAHIIARAKTLNCTDKLPADWPGSTKQEKTVMPEVTDIQKGARAMQKAAIGKAKGHIQKAMDAHGKAVTAFNEMHKCMGKADGAGESERHMRALGSHLESMADHHDLAMHALGRADADAEPGSVSPKNSEDGDVPKTTTESITVHPQVTMTEGGVRGSDFRGAGDSPYSAAAFTEMVKGALAPLEEKLGKVTEENAFMKGQMAVLERMPSGHQSRPRMIPGMTGAGSELLFNTSDPTAAVNKEISKAYSQINEEDPDATIAATARLIGLRAGQPRLFGQTLSSGGVAPLVISGK